MSGADAFAAEAVALGFVKTKYAWIERERRWLCREPPSETVLGAQAITDLYVDGTRLRLREARPLDGGEPLRRLTKKGDVRPDLRLITSIYLSEAEFALFRRLPGRTLRKTRHQLAGGLSFDVFEGALAGLVLTEKEFDSDEAMAAFTQPYFADREVTDDVRYGGGALARDGLPR